MRIINLVTAIIVGMIAFSGCNPPPSQPTSSEAEVLQDRGRVTLQINEEKLNVEVVTSVESITKGLGERDTIGSDGMLFVLPSRQVATFWMKGMRFGLDFVWIDGDTVVKLTEAVPAPEDPYSPDLPTYSSEVPVTHVLELPVGAIKQYRINVGDTVSLGSGTEQ